MIATIEQVSLNALPALQTFLFDGWVVRMGKGYSRRANSVQTFGAGLLPLDEKIAYCEMLYRQNDLPAIFKMTDASQPESLDAELERRGYLVQARTLVQTCDLNAFIAPPAPGVTIRETWDDVWYDEFCRMNAMSAAARPLLKQMLKLILPRTGYAILKSEQGICACGLGVLQGKYIGLFDIVTDTNARRRGHGRQLVSQLLKWGKANGGETAYLQVIEANTPARNLYAQLGFSDRYEYWYRVQS